MIFTMFIITDTIQVRSITAEINPLLSGGAFLARNTGRVIYTEEDERSTEFYIQRKMNIEIYLHWMII